MYLQGLVQSGLFQSSFTNLEQASLFQVQSPPTALSYSQPSATYTVGLPIAPNTPTVTGQVTSWSVDPALPAGLALDAQTGVIAGTPIALTAMAEYEVTAANSQGATSATLSLAVVPLGGPHQGGEADELRVVDLRWGRLVEVYAQGLGGVGGRRAHPRGLRRGRGHRQ